MTTLPKYYYLFKGIWIDRFKELEKMMESGKIQGFELWAQKDRSRQHHMIITYGKPLTITYSLVKSVWKTSESVFISFFEANPGQFEIHQVGMLNDGEKSEFAPLKDGQPA